MGQCTSLQGGKVDHQFPPWCVREPHITADHVKHVQASWHRLMNGESAAYHAAHKADPNITPLTFFYNSFYNHLFDWLPEVKPLFQHGIHAQGKMLANIMKHIVYSSEEAGKGEAKFVSQLQWLTRTHNMIGIQGQWYNVFGLSMLHTIRTCTDVSYFTEEVKQSWVLTYSRMMCVMIPVAVSGQLPKGEDSTLQQVFRKRAANDEVEVMSPTETDKSL